MLLALRARRCVKGALVASSLLLLPRAQAAQSPDPHQFKGVVSAACLAAARLLAEVRGVSTQASVHTRT
jgi:hypothetical protein